MLYDSHVHLDDPEGSVEQILQELAGLQQWQGALTAGYGPERFAASRAICDRDPRVVRAVGLHPWWLAARQPEEREQGWRDLHDELRRGPVAALGEIGVDRGLRLRMGVDEQLAWMERGLRLARQLQLPVVLHIVGWYGKALALLTALGGPWPGVVHRWSGPVELVPAYTALGLHISLALEPRSDAAKRAAVAQAVPSARLLVESDWPFGDLTYTQAVDETRKLAQQMALWRQEPAEELLQKVRDNARSLYLGGGVSAAP